MAQSRFDCSGWIRAVVWGTSATLILLPLFVMKAVEPRAWELEDLPFAFVMLAAVGLAFESAHRVPAGWTYRAGAALALATACLLVWGNLAVGFAGSENNAINILFFAVPAVALVGGIAGRFQPAGLAITMASAAAAQMSAGLIAWYHGYFTGPLTITFCGLWLASSLLFLRYSRARTNPETRGEPA